MSIITQAAEHGGHSTICSQYVSAAPLPPQRDTEDNLKGGGGGGGVYAGSWGVTEESSVMLIAVLIIEALRAAVCVWSPRCG